MSINLLKIVKDQVSDNFINKASETVSGTPANTKRAFTALIPSFISSILAKGSTESGASSLLDLIKNEGYNSNAGSSEVNLMNNKTSEIIAKGDSLVSKVMGENSGQLISNISQYSNLTKGGTEKLLSMIAPMVMGAIGKQVNQNKLNPSGLLNLLSEQSDYVKSAMPIGLEVPDFDNSALSKTSTAAKVSKKVSTDIKEKKETSQGGGGMIKWLLPLLLIGGFLLWFLNRDTEAKPTVKEKTEITKETTKAKSGHEGHDHADHTGHNHETATSSTLVESQAADIREGAIYTQDEAGNLIDKNGNIAYKAGSFKAIDGFYVDEDGNKLGKAFGAVKDAVVGAANATASAFTGLFSKMLKKEEGAKKTYLLTNISFDENSHKITNFSKGEVEGLASALKEFPDSKIEVQNFTTAGEKVSDLRAKVVKQMLVTLGVPVKQIESKGMGDSDKVKASGNKVEIVIK